MNRSFKSVFFILFILVLASYFTLFYSTLSCQYTLDFASFYSATLASVRHDNPYQIWLSTYLPVTKEIALNLNPPVFLILFQPFAHLSYGTGIAIWFLMCLITGLAAAYLVFYYVLSKESFRTLHGFLAILFLAMFSSMINLSLAQLGSILFFFLMLGYTFYLKRKDYYAGMAWGFIIAIKLFPALLFFLLLKQRRFRVLWVALATALFCSLLPFLVYGPVIYKQYFAMMGQVDWYVDSWNGSLYGFLSRLNMVLPDRVFKVRWLPFLYASLFLLLVALFYWRLGTKDEYRNHQPFALTLVMMLLLSPLGWVYYFQMLLLPLLLTWSYLIKDKYLGFKAREIWLLSLFLISFPVNNMYFKKIHGLIDLLSFSSFYFYGLLLLGYLLLINQNLKGEQQLEFSEDNQQFMLLALIIIAFGLIIPSTGFFMRLSNECVY